VRRLSWKPSTSQAKCWRSGGLCFPEVGYRVPGEAANKHLPNELGLPLTGRPLRYKAFPGMPGLADEPESRREGQLPGHGIQV